jgi:hypothetical protein
VWEWTSEQYDNAHAWRVLRGASWYDSLPERLTCLYRQDAGCVPLSRYRGLGFRLVLSR